ncbi:MAG: nucleotidyltransferase domain-containing protein [Candidatus Bathyarchaeia archaeon]|nr:nucleotidyltransferase domain-containing protein [Candidatus Bathyarchaeota archaeon]
MIREEYVEYINQIVTSLKDRLGERLISIVLFGSVARGDAGEGSDVDILVVSDSFKDSYGGRFQLFQEVEDALLSSEARMRLRKLGLGTLISPVPLTREEVKRNPPILLDILVDGLILYDKDSFMERHLRELDAKLKALKARRIQLPGGRWYWDLKPDYKLGEVVEI